MDLELKKLRAMLEEYLEVQREVGWTPIVKLAIADVILEECLLILEESELGGTREKESEDSAS